MNYRTRVGLTSLLGSLIIFTCMHALTAHTYWKLFWQPLGSIILLIMILSAADFTWMIVWWIAYQPVDIARDTNKLPRLSVVMPVYNESHFVFHALYSILQSSYPRDKLEVIAVDDGSTDDTWNFITAMTTIYTKAGVNYRIYQHKKNLGKRFAIKSGFEIATGEIIVSLDSDSVLERSTLLALIAPLLNDERVGGVAGHLSVLNMSDHMIPKLLDILFDASGNIPRAAQSRACGAVTILPGALSAFRAAAVRPLLEDLCQSVFWGTTIKHGEDVELTLGLLSRGWKTLYQRNAVVYTNAPETIRKALLMYTRWERSSYTYLFSGFIQLAGGAVVDKINDWLKPTSQLWQMTTIEPMADQESFHPKESSPLRHGSILGRFFLLLNLVSTATTNLFLPCTIYAQLCSAIHKPRNILFGVIAVFLLSGLQTLLFLADTKSYVDHEKQELEESAQSAYDIKVDQEAYSHVMASAGESGTIRPTIIGHKMRLRGRFQYGGIAVMFHCSVIVWASMIAMLTLRSQKWLTR